MKNKHPVLRRFMRRKVSVVAAAVLILFVLIAILGPLVWQVDPLKQSVMKKYGPMTVQHPLGTDNLGRDTLARMIYGARVSLAISFAGVLSGALIGVLLGVSAGYFGGWVDAIISRFIDILLAFPGLLLAITIVAVLGPGSVNTVIAITIFTIPGLTRMVRSVVLSLKSSEYVEACKTMGESNLRIILTHVIPNSMSQIIVNVTLSLGTAILTASSLSFLGLGVTPPEAEWGAMLSQMRDGAVYYHEMQYWANHGYYVIYCNPRGGESRGNEFGYICGRFGTIDYDDIMAFCDEALKAYPDMDEKHMGVTGGSYGGFMTNWIIGHTNRFAAAASQRGIANFVSMEGTSDIGTLFAERQILATTHTNLDKMWNQSPLKYADRCTTPTLFIHSEEDYRCWMVEALQMYSTLIHHGVPTRLCLFHGENHELSRGGKPKGRIRRLQEITAWMDKYLKEE